MVAVGQPFRKNKQEVKGKWSWRTDFARGWALLRWSRRITRGQVLILALLYPAREWWPGLLGGSVLHPHQSQRPREKVVGDLCWGILRECFPQGWAAQSIAGRDRDWVLPPSRALHPEAPTLPRGWVWTSHTGRDLPSLPETAAPTRAPSSGSVFSSLMKRLDQRLIYCCSVAQPCSTHCDFMDWSMPGFPVLHHVPELAQTLVHWVSDAIQPSRPLSSPSPPAFSLSQHQCLF